MSLRFKITRMMCNLTCKKALILLFSGFVATIFFGYFLFYNHDDPDMIMANNRRAQEGGQWHKDTRHMDETELEVHEEERKAIEYWEKFVKDHKYTAIGEVYDNCDEEDRMMVGRTVMLPNNAFLSRIKARTFVNVTLDSEVTGGMFFIEVQYNGNNIFNRQWELCTLDEGADDQIVFCPFEPRDYSVVKDKGIPSILPRGRYQTKAFVKDQNDDIMLCGFSDFTI